MNPRIHVLCLVLAAALSAPALCAATEAASPIAFRINKVTAENASIERGASLPRVREALGEPYRRLSSDIHLFNGYHADLPESEKLGCDTLVVTYTGGLVSDLKLVNSAALKVIAASLRRTGFDGLVAVKDDRAKQLTPPVALATTPHPTR
jgi:hypothetical protein